MLAWERDLNLIPKIGTFVKLYVVNPLKLYIKKGPLLHGKSLEVVYQSCSKCYCMVSPLDADKNRTKVS